MKSHKLIEVILEHEPAAWDLGVRFCLEANAAKKSNDDYEQQLYDELASHENTQAELTKKQDELADERMEAESCKTELGGLRDQLKRTQNDLADAKYAFMHNIACTNPHCRRNLAGSRWLEERDVSDRLLCQCACGGKYTLGLGHL